ncbi:MAG: hypothetical protein JWM93_1154 [Frankiales bacterium]|nr:hypothetical protein [Frankiales bacterium]
MTDGDGTVISRHHQLWLDAHPHASGLPAWLRKSTGESRLPIIVAIGAVIALQLLVPAHFALQPKWVLASIEGLLLAVLIAANPRRLTRDHPALRLASLGLTAVVTFTNVASAVLLVHNLIYVRGDANDATSLLGGGASIYLTNIIAFGLWYWEFDRGGPIPRGNGQRAHPDFLFPQMASPELSDSEWEPNLVDYLYVSFTNATAFSPTDTMPLSRWAKALMAVQSMVALTTVGLVIARAVNVLA